MRLAALEHFLVVIFVHDCSLFLLLLLLLLLMVLLLLLQQHSTYVSLIKSQARGCSTKMSQLWNVLPFVIIIFHNALHPSSLPLPLPLFHCLSPVSCSGHVNSKIMIHYAGVPSIVVTSSKSQRRDEKEDHKKEKPKEKGHGDNTQKAENGCGWRCSHASSLS